MNLDVCTTGDDYIAIPLALSPYRALALAQFCKRISWAEVRQNAVDDAEASVMMQTLVAVQMALDKVGVAPR